LAGETASAFVVAPSRCPRPSTQLGMVIRSGYQYQLELGKDFGEGKATVNGKKVPLDEAKSTMEGDIRRSRRQTRKHQENVSELESQIRGMEVEHANRVENLKQQMEYVQNNKTRRVPRGVSRNNRKTHPLLVDGDREEHDQLIDAQEHARKAQASVARLQMELRLKEEQQKKTLGGLQEMMKRQEGQLELAKAHGEGFKAEAEKEKKALFERYSQREQELTREIETLRVKLGAESTVAASAHMAVGKMRAEMKYVDSYLLCCHRACLMVRAFISCRTREQELLEQVWEVGGDATRARLNAHREKMELIENHEFREKLLKAQMETLSGKLEEAKQSVNNAKEYTEKIIDTKSALDNELKQLKKCYEEQKMQHEQELNEMQKLMEARSKKEKQEIEQQFDQRERELKNKMDKLNQKLQFEKQETTKAKMVSNEMFKSRLAMDTQLNEVSEKLTREQRARAQDVKQAEETMTQLKGEIDELKELQKEVAKLKEERQNIGKLAGGLLKTMAKKTLGYLDDDDDIRVM